MTEQEFTQRFEAALEEAIQLAEEHLHRDVPHQARVRLHGAYHSGDLMEVDEAVKALYLGEDLFYRIIDVSVIELHPDHAVIFVRASAHKPSSWEQTLNTPPGSGPFNQLICLSVKVFNT